MLLVEEVEEVVLEAEVLATEIAVLSGASRGRM